MVNRVPNRPTRFSPRPLAASQVTSPDRKLAALSAFTDVLLTKRGLPSKAEVEAFLAAGYEERQVLENILAIAVKMLSNYSNHLFHTALDPAFVSREWKKSA
jgi:alkylhydroperoxidase family enzyme